MNKTFGAGADVKAAYDNLNKALVETAFGIPTNTYDSRPDRCRQERRRASRSTSTTCWWLRTLGFKP